MHVLVLNEYFPPDTSATAKNAALVVDALAERHRVTVLAGRPSYDPTERHPPYLMRREVHGNLVVERVGSTAFPRFRMKRRVSNYLTYLALAVPRALTIRSDVVRGHDRSSHRRHRRGAASRDFPAGRSSTTCATCIRTWRSAERSSARGRGCERWEKLHRRALRRAARVIVLGEDMRERILAKGRRSSAHRDRSRRRAVSRDAAALPIIPWCARFAANFALSWFTPAISASTARGKR